MAVCRGGVESGWLWGWDTICCRVGWGWNVVGCRGELWLCVEVGWNQVGCGGGIRFVVGWAGDGMLLVVGVNCGCV